MFETLKCVSDNVNLDDYYELYNNVRKNMKHPEWLGLIPIDEAKKILLNGGKIWLYYKNNDKVCSMFYIPSNEKTLRKHHIETKATETGSLGPIMVNPKYIGNGFMNSMMKVFDEYNKEIGNKYIFTKVARDNIYSIRNLEKNNYILCDTYENERGLNNAYLKNL